MRRRNREISIFSMSALDLFASALGAFILLTIVIFPYFPNISPVVAAPEEPAPIPDPEPDDLRERVEEAERRYRDLWERYQREVRRGFVMVAISWSTGDDVDLHIIDPRGNEYYYAAREHRGSPARFEEDTTRGPGNEFWLHPRVEPGVYEVYYNLFSHRDLENVPSVRGVVAHSRDRNELPVTRLNVQGDLTLVARVAVDEDRNVTIER